MKAYVNHGRWIVECVTPYCGNAWLADTPPTTCDNCGMRVPHVEWPTEKQVIESVLSRRTVPETRNWWPHETVEDLKHENILMGVD